MAVASESLPVEVAAAISAWISTELPDEELIVMSAFLRRSFDMMGSLFLYRSIYQPINQCVYLAAKQVERHARDKRASAEVRAAAERNNNGPPPTHTHTIDIHKAAHHGPLGASIH